MTIRLNPIEALFASLTGMDARDAQACGNWTRLNTRPQSGPVMILAVDPMLLAAAAARDPRPVRTAADPVHPARSTASSCAQPDAA